MMNKDIYLYLAGSLTYLLTHNMFYKATRWRNDLDTWALDNGIKTFNPAKVYSVEKNHNYSDKMIVDQNNFFLNKTTIMVVQLEYLDQSPGTIYELISYKTMGKPVIAFGGGGALETVIDKVTGLFFYEQKPSALKDRILEFINIENNFDPKIIRKHALGFDEEVFKKKIINFIISKYSDFLKNKN